MDPATSGFPGRVFRRLPPATGGNSLNASFLQNAVSYNTTETSSVYIHNSLQILQLPMMLRIERIFALRIILVHLFLYSRVRRRMREETEKHARERA